MNKWQRWKNIMKAQPFEEKRLSKWEPPYIIQPKYDGIRCRAIPLEGGRYMLLSSEENVIHCVPHINEALARMMSHFGNIEFDGELYVHGWSFEQIISIAGRSVNTHPDYKKMQYHIFDYVSDEAQGIRTTHLSKQQVESPLAISPFWLANNLQEVMSTFNELVAWGYEGIIVRHFMAPYERKRSLYVMKFKPKQKDVYKVIGYKEEIDIHGNPKNTLGALVCIGKDGNEFSVGTGFSSEARRIYWNKREKLVGRLVKISYQHITPGRSVPRFPVFSEVIK
jgi:ATP-dependent DNA ligase